MKIHLVKKESINGFIARNAKAKAPFNNWIAILKRADWNNPNDIQATFNSADMLGNGTNRVVFNLGGNNYRMICQYHFGEKRSHLFIKWIGDHKEYTRLCEKGEQYTIDVY